MSLTVKVAKTSLRAFSKSAAIKSEMFKRELKTAMKKTVIDVQSTAKKAGYVPVRTGNLRRSLTHDVTVMGDGVMGRVGSNLAYARIQEFGGQAGRNRSAKIKGQFYLTRAVQENEDKAKERFKKIMAARRR